MKVINNLEYRGFYAKLNHDPDSQKVIGCIADIDDFVAFESKD